jgi:hypothetical protein
VHLGQAVADQTAGAGLGQGNGPAARPQRGPDPALQRLAKIVHSADVATDIDKDPIARGLEAIAVGYSLRYPDDEENLEYQFEVYDALYAWCRLQVAKG